MSLLVYVGAVLRHWIASMSGIAALVVATALQWRYITPTEGALDPRLWWTIAAICFVAAMFLAWFDEYRRRRSAEASGPKLVLEHISPRIILIIPRCGASQTAERRMR